jgi:hypothetical protein
MFTDNASKNEKRGAFLRQFGHLAPCANKVIAGGSSCGATTGQPEGYSNRLFTVNGGRGLSINAKNALHMIIHVMDFGNATIGAGGLDAGISRGNTDNRCGHGSANLA